MKIIFQNSTPSEPQLGMNNPQFPIPFNGNYASNGVNMPNIPNSRANQPGFMNGPNNHLGMPHLSSIGPIPQPGKPHVGFGPQNSASNMNPVAAAFPVRGQASFGHNNNVLGFPQFNQNGPGLPFGQFCLPNALQGMNQFAPMQMPLNLSQFVAQNAFGILNHAPQNPPGFLANPQFGNLHYNQIVQQLNQNQHNLPMPAMDVNALNLSPVVTQQLQGNLSTAITGSVQTEQTKSNLQSNGFMGSQGNHAGADGFNAARGNWKNQSGKNFTRNPKRGMPQGGSQNPQFRGMKNGRNFGFPNAHKGRGLRNEKPANFGITNSKNQGNERRRRSLCLTYTEQEIQQWREERRKNYPSKGNIEKKLAEKTLDKEGLEKEAKLRREQLKEILAKQAELGVEVAEIPRCYLADQKNEGQGGGENGRPLAKNGRSRNRFDKRGRYDKRDRYSKKQRLNDDASSNVPSLSVTNPTLLQKLLSADIKRDKSHLLQVFRFMVLNSFFANSSDKPLKFPSVVAKDGSEEDARKDVSEISDKTVVGEVDSDNEKNENYNGLERDSDDDGGDDNNESYCDRQEDGEEEGEIIN